MKFLNSIENLTSMSVPDKVEDAAPEAEEPAEEVPAKKQRRKANKAPYSPKKLAKKMRAGQKKETTVAEEDFLSKARKALLPIWRDYVRVFLLRNLLAVTVVVCAVVIVYLQIVAMNTLPTQNQGAMQSGGMKEFTERVVCLFRLFLVALVCKLFLSVTKNLVSK